MRIAFTSDLHWEPRCAAAIDATAAEAARCEPDVLVLGGDLGEPLEHFRRCLHAFRDVPAGAKLAVAGNHDVWNRVADPRAGRVPSARLLESALPAAAREEGFTWLEAESVHRSGVAFVGSLAWYDYSGGDRALPHDDATYATLKATLNNDGNFIDWPWTDRELAARLGERFLERLVAAARTAERVVVVTHVPLFAEHIERAGRDESWRFANAYFFNLGLGARVLAEPKVSLVLSGHTHMESVATLRRPGAPPLLSLVCGSDYGVPRLHVVDVGAEGARIV